MHRLFWVLVVGFGSAGCGVDKVNLGQGHDANADAPGLGPTLAEVETEARNDDAPTPGFDSNSVDAAVDISAIVPGDAFDGSADDGTAAAPGVDGVVADEGGREALSGAGVDGDDELDLPGPDDALEDAPPGASDDAPDAATDATGEVDSTFCNAPSCYADLMQGCKPGDTCVQQTNGYDTAQCYDNGVKVVVTVDTKAATRSTVVMNGTRVCYRLDYDLVALLTGAAVVGYIRDGSGATVATLGDDVSGRSTVTCNGGSPVVLNQACDANSGAAPCTAGTCIP
jgi:hypothetical protein